MEAKHEANRTKEEMERQAELEREVSAWLHVCSLRQCLPKRVSGCPLDVHVLVVLTYTHLNIFTDDETARGNT